MSEPRFGDAEQEGMDRLLRRSMAAPPPLGLSPGFERRLERRLAPRRLSSNGRLMLGLYTLAALGGSIGVMRSEALAWSFIVAALAVPLVIVATVWRRHLSPAS